MLAFLARGPTGPRVPAVGAWPPSASSSGNTQLQEPLPSFWDPTPSSRLALFKVRSETPASRASFSTRSAATGPCASSFERKALALDRADLCSESAGSLRMSEALNFEVPPHTTRAAPLETVFRPNTRLRAALERLFLLD